MQTGRWVPAALLLAMGGTAGRAEEFAIQELDKENARIVFDAIAGATNYQVRTAPTPTGIWSVAVGTVPPTAANAVTATVSMASATAFYRVAAFTNVPPATGGLYLLVDISGGPSAPSYPVTYLDAVPPGGWTDEHKTTKLVLRRIPATAGYSMGSPGDELGHESDETQHQVTLTQDFYIGVFEVTQKQWERVMDAAPSAYAGDKRPVEQVIYDDIRGSSAGAGWPANGNVDASSFMGKLRDRTGLPLDLPTESQWEYACRAGTTRAYNDQTQNGGAGSDCLTTGPGSDANLEPLAWYYANSYSQKHRDVGTKQANAWGLYDMHGNVWEWCLDWYGGYPGTVADPVGAGSGSGRVIRGGGWGTLAKLCRSADRINNGPSYRSSSFGLRACSASPVQ